MQIFKFAHQLITLVIFSSSLLLAACGGGSSTSADTDDNTGSNTDEAPSVAARTAQLDANDPDCPNGGILVETGIDENRNGRLDNDEVDTTEKVCHGKDGRNGNAGSAGSPQIAIDTAGNAFAVWAQHDGTRSNIWVNRYVPGSGWGKAELIETDNTGDARSPQIAIDAADNAFAVWQQYDGTRSSIWANLWSLD